MTGFNYKTKLLLSVPRFGYGCHQIVTGTHREVLRLVAEFPEYLPAFPTEPGLYVFDGEISGCASGFVGAEVVDADMSLSGEWRRPLLNEVFVFYLQPPGGREVTA